MKKMIMMIILIPLLIVGFIAGRFFYTVYASEYHYQVENQNENQEHIDSLRIGTYNIKSLNYDENNLQQFQQDISNLNLDVICLQEVDKNAWRSGNFDMLEKMSEDNGYDYYHFYASMWIVDGYYGLGILSKYPIVEVSSNRLPNSLLKEPRLLTKTTINVNQQNIDIYNTHLTYENNDIRVNQMNTLKTDIDFDGYTILTGDFNSFGMNNDFSIDNVASLNKDKTYSTFMSFGAPDDIYYSSRFEVVEEGMKQSSFSDHNILYGEFTIHS